MNDELFEFHMNSQIVSFIDDRDGTFIKRTIIYSPTISQRDIYNYFLLSISRKVRLTFSEIESCICLFKPQELTKYTEGRIDNYWMDGVVYLMTDKNKHENKYTLLVLPSDLENHNIFNTLRRQKGFICSDIIDNCWIKRQGIEYDVMS